MDYTIEFYNRYLKIKKYDSCDPYGAHVTITPSEYPNHNHVVSVCVIEKDKPEEASLHTYSLEIDDNGELVLIKDS